MWVIERNSGRLLPTALSDIAHGYLSPGAYVKSLLATRVESVFRWNDPLPFLMEVLLLPSLIASKRPSGSKPAQN